MTNQKTPPEYLVAVDLGSNSFHMLVTRIEDGHIHILDTVIEKIIAHENRLTLHFAKKDELRKYPLRITSLKQEADYLRKVHF